MKKIIFLFSIIIIQSCSTTTNGPSGAGIVGNNINTNYSLEDLRKANTSIIYSETLPANAEIVSEITTRRCHRMATDPVPSEETLMNDLKLLVYTQGGDGFTDYKLKKHNGKGLLYNCWQLRDASAKMFKFN
jgi:hypothetical protein